MSPAGAAAFAAGLVVVAAARLVPSAHPRTGAAPPRRARLPPDPLGRRRRAHRRAVAAAYPDALELIVLAVRAGHLPAAAIRAAAPHLPPAVAEAFADVLAQVDSGQRFADALAALRHSVGPAASPLVDSFAAADRYGLPLAPIVERLAAEARHQRRRRTEAVARQLPIRMAAPLVLCTLPSFVLLAVAPLLLAAISSLAW